MTKAKHNQESFADFLEKLKIKSETPSRPVEAIEERKYFLIVSEGERTEPLYFDYYKKFLPKHLLETLNVHGEGDNTLNIVRKVIELRDNRKKDILLPDFDECWAVYDKDDFPDKNFNDAVALAQKEDIQSAHSNQSFELWYILHYQFLNTCLHRKDYGKLLSKHLGFKYKKNDIRVVEHLFSKGNVIQAIEWAKDLEGFSLGLTPSKSCPTTKVYELVISLREYLKHDS